MPNPEAIKKAAERRATRTEARANTAERLAAETQELSRITELQNAAPGNPEAAAELLALQPAKAVVPKLSKKGRQLEERKAAEVQADKDARVVAEMPETALNLAYYTSRGEEPPLHVLNHIAQANDRVIRDDARELARAVGQVAYEQATTRDARGRHAREKRMHAALAEAAALRAAKVAE